MLATTNLGSVAILFPVAVCAVVLAAGCSPPGTRASRDGDRLMREATYAPTIEKLQLAAGCSQPGSHAPGTTSVWRITRPAKLLKRRGVPSKPSA